MSCACAQDGNKPPRILNLQDYQLSTNQNFQLEITAFDPDQDFIEFNFNLSPPPPTPTETSGGVPTLQRVSNTQAVFSWTPGVADAGQYILTVTVSDPSGEISEESITLTVTESSGMGAVWARFIEPLGDATILDLARTSCLEESVRVQADQVSDDELQLALLPPSPPGASLTALGPKAYTLTWCPQSSELTAQSAFPFRIQASTVRGFPPIDKSYLVRVRTETADSCPGDPPVISHQRPSDYIGVANVALSVEVTDDLGIKSAPTISYQTVARGAPPSLDGAWDTILMTGDGPGGMTATGISTRWSAQLPPSRDPAGATIYYRFLVTDDDDPEGAVCDHSIESELYQVNYQWDPNMASLGASLCEPCIDDVQCGGPLDRCLLGVSGGVCGRECDHELGCPEVGFQCQQVMGSNGMMSAQCVSENACGSVCQPDVYDTGPQSGVNNDSPERASAIMSDAQGSYSICAGDLDYYRVELLRGQNFTARIDFNAALGDLDLEVREEMNRGTFPVRRSASSNNDFEEVSVRCVAQDTSAIIQVYGFEGAQNEYSMSLSVETTPCESQPCYPDEYEGQTGNNDTFSATFADLGVTYAGRICPMDIDVYGVTLTAGQQVRATLSLDPSQGDLALDLVDEYQTLLESSSAPGRNREVIEFTASNDMEVYFKVLSLQANANNEYQLIVSGAEAMCERADACSPDEYCDPSRGCTSSACSGSCGAGHACVSPLAGRVPAADDGMCAPVCDNDAMCRSGERCKAFESFTTRCAPAGVAGVAEGCRSFADCADDLVCLPANGGYCAAAGCFNDDDCSADTLCDTLFGVLGCLKRCTVDADCGRPDLRCQDFSSGRACAP